MIATEKEKAGSYYDLSSKLAIYVPNALGTNKAKTAEGVLRYGSNPILAIVDASKVGLNVKDVTGIASDAPVVASIDDALALKPDALLLGTAWAGGGLPEEWRADIIKSIEAGLDIINGLHDFLSDDPEILAAAQKHGTKLLDVRRPPDDLPVGKSLAVNVPAFTVLTVGSDCSVGKMTTSLEIAKIAKERNKKAAFVATGQTGIMICGTGIAIDRVIGDFMAGAVEQMVLEAAEGNEYVLVEGQGSIVHPSFSGVTLALMHGACPQAMILCHNASRSKIKGLQQDLLPLSELVEIYERMCAYLRPSKVVGVAFNTYGMTEDEAMAAISSASQNLGLPVCDPVRQGAAVLFDAIEKYKESMK